MVMPPFQLSDDQVRAFDKFLFESTANMLSALETVFELSIDCSDSSIEIAAYANNQNLHHFGSGPLYIVSSALLGDVTGSAFLLMRADDFNHLSVVMKPVMSNLYPSGSGQDSSASVSEALEAAEDQESGQLDETIYRGQMMDALAEMGNILIGLNTKSIHRMCGLNSRHSVPLVMLDSSQRTTQSILSVAGGLTQLHMAIENEFFLNDKPIKLWCLISPTKDSFRKMLNGLDRKAGEARDD